MSQTVDVAIVGATGAVGETLISVLEQREFPLGQLFLLASERSAGQSIRFRGRSLTVRELAQFDFSQAQFGLFSAGASVSAQYAEGAAAAGCTVIDNTAHFRRDPAIPLVVPEVNAGALAHYRRRNIIANPNCSTIQLVVALKPLYDAVGIERINVASYQSVSGSGRAAIAELAQQSASVLDGRAAEPVVYPRQIAFNALPHIDSFEENGYTREEMKIVWETRKIFADESIQVNPSCVRIPVFYGHSEAVHIETRDKITAAQARALLANAPGVELLDRREDGGYPTAVSDCAGQDAVWVGRIREDISHPRGLNLWVVSDNLRKGAALNSVQIAECLLKNGL